MNFPIRGDGSAFSFIDDSSTEYAGVGSSTPGVTDPVGNVFHAGLLTTLGTVSVLTNPMTTAGDLLYEDATPAPNRLPIGTTGYVLTVVAGLPAWAAAVTSLAGTANQITASASAGAVTLALANPLITGLIELGTWPVAGTYAFIGRSDFDQTMAPNYSILIAPTGQLFINAPAVGINYRIANADIFTVTSAEAAFSVPLLLSTTQTVVSGSTSGTATFTQPFAGPSTKRVIVYLSALLGTASYTFPIAFTDTPAVVTTNGPAATVVTSLSASAVTITGTTTTGFVIIEGF